MASNTRLSVLKNRSDFLFILKNGQRVRPSDWLVLNFVINNDDQFRCGWTLPRQVGSAVIRNRLKRWTRIYFREVLQSGKAISVDVNVVFRRADTDFYKKLDYERFCRVLDRGWQQVKKRAGKGELQGSADSSRTSRPKPSSPVRRNV